MTSQLLHTAVTSKTRLGPRPHPRGEPRSSSVSTVTIWDRGPQGPPRTQAPMKQPAAPSGTTWGPRVDLAPALPTRVQTDVENTGSAEGQEWAGWPRPRGGRAGGRRRSLWGHPAHPPQLHTRPAAHVAWADGGTGCTLCPPLGQPLKVGRWLGVRQSVRPWSSSKLTPPYCRGGARETPRLLPNTATSKFLRTEK